MTPRKAILITNPKTGRYASRRLLGIEEISARLRACDIAVEVIATTGPGHATQIAAAAARNGNTDVIVSGGDGTINEALQGLIGSEARLGILPRGTGNVLARELRLPLDSMRAAEVIARGKTKRVHVGSAKDDTNCAKRYFLLMGGIGLDASVVRKVDPRLKKRFGRAAFWVSGLSHLADWRPTPFELEVEGKTYSATFATIGKAATYGGNLSVTPRARIDEPNFEICLIESHSRMRYLHLLSYALGNGVPAGNPGVRFISATRARATGKAAVQVDGELIGHLPMTFEIAPESIEIIVP